MSAPHPYSLQGTFLQTPPLSEIIFGPQERSAFAGIADAVMQGLTGGKGKSPAGPSASPGPTSSRQLENQRMAAATMAMMQQRQAQR